MTSTSTRAHSSINVASPLRSPGHATPNHGSRSNTPARLIRLGQTQPDACPIPLTLEQTGVPSGNVRRTNSASPLEGESATIVSTSASSNGRRRRLSVTSYRDAAPVTARDSNSPTIIDDALSRRPHMASPLLTTHQAAPISASSPVLSLQLPLTAYVVLEFEDLVASAAAHVLDPSVRCAVVVAPSGPTHILNRQDVEQRACRCHDPFSDTLGARLADLGTPHCPAVDSGATVAQAAGQLLLAEARSQRAADGGGRQGERDHFVVADPASGRVVGLVNRSDLAEALLRDAGDQGHENDPSGDRTSGSGAYAPRSPKAGRISGEPASSPDRLADGAGLKPGYEVLEQQLQQRRKSQQRSQQQQHKDTSCVSSSSAHVELLNEHRMPTPIPTASVATSKMALGPTRSGAHVTATAYPNPPPALPPSSSSSAKLITSSSVLQAAAVAAAPELSFGSLVPSLDGATSQQQPQQSGAQEAVGGAGGSADEVVDVGSDVSADSNAVADSVDGPRLVPDPIRSGWDMLDTVDDALDVLGLVGRAVNAEAVGRRLLGDVATAAGNVVGGSSSTGWLFKYMYDGDCAICHTFQSMLEKLDNGLGRLAFVDISSPAFNSLEHGGINVRAAMETLHILSANGEVFKGVTAFIKLVAAVDPDWAANSNGLMAVLPLISLSYMVLSRHRKQLSGAWGALLRAKGLDGAAGGRTGGGEGGVPVQATAAAGLRMDVGCGGGGGGGVSGTVEKELRSHLLRTSESGAA